MVLTYTLIFSKIMSPRFPDNDNYYAYSIYLCAGLILWGLFSEIVVNAQNIFLDNATLLKKINFPRLCLPIILILNALISFTIIFVLFTLFLLMTGNFPGWVLLNTLPLIFLLITFSIGLGVSLGVLNVFFRDVGQFFIIFINFWFWLTPIVYPADILPERVRFLLVFNPMAPLMQAYQGILVLGLWPHWESLILVMLISLALCSLGLNLFRKHAGEIVDEL
jgi:lipopolysaccharide transport system permease protein